MDKGGNVSNIYRVDGGRNFGQKSWNSVYHHRDEK